MVIDRKKVQEELMKLKKEDLAQELASILRLLFEYGNMFDEFSIGWRESRKSIIILCNLDRFLK